MAEYTHNRDDPRWKLEVGGEFATLSYVGPYVAREVEVEFIEYWNPQTEDPDTAERVTSTIETASMVSSEGGALPYPLVSYPGHGHVQRPRAFAYRVRWTEPDAGQRVLETGKATPPN